MLRGWRLFRLGYNKIWINKMHLWITKLNIAKNKRVWEMPLSFYLPIDLDLVLRFKQENEVSLITLLVLEGRKFSFKAAIICPFYTCYLRPCFSKVFKQIPQWDTCWTILVNNNLCSDTFPPLLGWEWQRSFFFNSIFEQLLVWITKSVVPWDFFVVTPH